MKMILTSLAIIMTMAAATHAGTIIGSVRAEGKAGAEADALCGKYDSRQFKFIERINYAELRDFLVFIEGPVGKVVPPEKPAQVKTERITQKGATFVPHVLPVVVGTTVEWPNNDDILHNVFSFSETRQFDLGLYKNPTTPKTVLFDKAGRVDVFCSIHSRMSCIVMVLENPFFSMTNDKGRFTIQNVPPGKYKLKAWHERLPGQSQEITIPETGEVKADFVLGITGLPKL
jgi:plastocyanin